MAKTGRPSKYTKQLPDQARMLSRAGFTDAEMAEFWGVAPSTLYKWKLEYSEFSEALKDGKSAADDRVVNSLFHKAVGYTHDTEEIRVVSGEIVRIPVKKHYPPDTTAMIFWLKNRQSQMWTNGQANAASMSPSNMSEEEIDARITELLWKIGKASRANQ